MNGIFPDYYNLLCVLGGFRVRYQRYQLDVAKSCTFLAHVNCEHQMLLRIPKEEFIVLFVFDALWASKGVVCVHVRINCVLHLYLHLYLYLY